MTIRRIAILDALAGLLFTAAMWWGHRNYRGSDDGH